MFLGLYYFNDVLFFATLLNLAWRYIKWSIWKVTILSLTWCNLKILYVSSNISNQSFEILSFDNLNVTLLDFVKSNITELEMFSKIDTRAFCFGKRIRRITYILILIIFREKCNTRINYSARKRILNKQREIAFEKGIATRKQNYLALNRPK